MKLKPSNKKLITVIVKLSRKVISKILSKKEIMRSKNGKEIVEALANKLNEDDVRCYDSAIVRLLEKLDNYDLQQLCDSGEVAKWVRERTKKRLANAI